MKIVNTFNPEFGYELIAAVPYAYYLFVNNKLEKTISGALSEPLYYFSPNHEINPDLRSWGNTLKFLESGIPNAMIHKPSLDTSEFIVPPYKKQFANNIYKWDKPTVCICNRYNREWGKNPINYFSLEILEEIFNLLKDKYKIVYFGVDILEEMQDSAHSLSIGDVELCNRYSDVILFQNLLKESNLTWNELQLMVYANCDKFITMNGGYSVLASFFGGTNLIYCKQSTEINPRINSFSRWYSEFSNSRIVVSQTYEDVVKTIQTIFLGESPLVNVLIKTKKNEIGFVQCVESIKSQTHKNINIIACVESGDTATDNYVIKESCRVIFYEKISQENAAFLMSKISHGLVVYMNDKEKYDTPNALADIITENNLIAYDNCDTLANKNIIYKL